MRLRARCIAVYRRIHRSISRAPPHCGRAGRPARLSLGELSRRFQVQRLRWGDGQRDALATPYRLAFLMRMVEHMSIEETAAALHTPAATVKTRVHRANQQLRTTLGVQCRARRCFPIRRRALRTSHPRRDGPVCGVDRGHSRLFGGDDRRMSWPKCSLITSHFRLQEWAAEDKGVFS